MSSIDIYQDILLSHKDCHDINEIQEYIKIISKSTISPNYSEKHHILPRAIWPEYKNTDTNIVRLSPYDHFLAHFHLAKALGGKALNALIAMNCHKGLMSIDEAESCAKMYESLREKYSDYCKNKAVYIYSDGRKQKLSVDHPDVLSGKAQHINKNRKHSEEANIRKSELNKNITTFKYEDGRNVRLSVDHPDVLSGKAQHINKNRKMTPEQKSSLSKAQKKMVNVIYQDGKISRLYRNHPDLLNGNATIYGKKGYGTYRYPDGSTMKLPTNHPDVIGGIVVGARSKKYKVTSTEYHPS